MATLTPPRTVSEVHQLLRSRDASAAEIAQSALDAIDALELRLNAFITVTADLGHHQARRLDDELENGRQILGLVGVPVAVKDCLLATGAPTSGGSSVFSGYAPVGDAAVVSKLRDSGAILVGKTNMNEFCWGLDEAIGEVRNPVNVEWLAGGSSGGSAASVASGSVIAAVGTDSGGSIRLPAAYCAVAGLKPTHGLISSDGILPGCWSLTDCGPLSRTVKGVRLLLESLASVKIDRPTSVGLPSLGLLSGCLEGCHPSIAAGLRRALSSLQARRWIINEVELDLDGAREYWMEIFAAETATRLLPFLGDRVSELSVEVQDLINEGSSLSHLAYLEAQEFRRRARDLVDNALDDLDALLMPTTPSPPPGSTAMQATSAESELKWTVPANLTGHPALTIPVPGDIPTGLQLVGRAGDDAHLLAIGEAVEAALAELAG